MPQKTQETPKIRIKLRAFDSKVLDSAAKQIIDIALRCGVKVSGPIPLPTEVERFTVLRPTFVHKDSREQYERRIHKRLIEVANVNQKFLDSLKNLNLPAGIDVQIKT